VLLIRRANSSPQLDCIAFTADDRQPTMRIAGARRAMAPLPAGTVLVEAESLDGGGRTSEADPAASGGQATRQGTAWGPLLIVDVPSSSSATLFTIWARHRGGPLGLKAEHNGKQTDHDWNWVAPDRWTWTRLGRFPAKDLGQRIIIIRSDQGDPRLDCMAFTTDDVAPNMP
jgi:hypothetical protein